MTDYCSIADVRLYTSVQSVDISDEDISSFITDASSEIDRLCGNPREIRNEIHRGDGRRFRYRIGGRATPRKSVTEIIGVTLRERGVTGELVLNEINPTYPRDTNEWTSDDTSWDISGGTSITLDTSDYKCGSGSISVQASSQGTAFYPSSKDLDFGNYSDWGYLFFHYKSTSTDTITVKIVEDTSNYLSFSLTPSYQNRWLWIFKDISDMSETGDVSKVDYIEFTVPAGVTLKIDGMCFSDGYAIENPDGNIGYVIFQEEPYDFSIDYFYNPFNPTPTEIKMACANLAAAYIFERLSGYRLKETSGTIQIDTMEAIRDDFRGLAGQAFRHRKTAMAILGGVGFDYKTYWVDDEL